MRTPTIHTNGTSADALTQALETAVNALRHAQEALSDCQPNGRDYSPQGVAGWREALAEHVARVEKLSSVRAELEAMWEVITNSNAAA